MTDAVTATAEDYSKDAELLGHPVGLYVCFATELWERFSFYGMKYLLLLYLTKYHLFTDQMGLDVLGSYAGLVYALPLIGGMIAARFLGMRKSVLFGGILLSLGHILMAVEGYQAIFYAAGTTLTENLTLASGEVLVAGTVLAEDITMRDTAALKVFWYFVKAPMRLWQSIPERVGNSGKRPEKSGRCHWPPEMERSSSRIVNY